MSLWQQIEVYTVDRFSGIDFDTMIDLSVKPRLLMKDSNRQWLKTS